MPDELDAVLRLVAEGRLSPEEAEPILAALESQDERDDLGPRRGAARSAAERRIRVQVLESDRPVVDLNVPLGIAGIAASLVPGLSEETAARIREAVRVGEAGTILDVGEGGERVIISVE